QQLHPEAQQRLAGTSTHLMRMAPHVSDEALGKEFHRLLQAHPPEHARAIARWYGLRKGDQPRDLGRKARSAAGKLPEALPEGPYLSKTPAKVHPSEFMMSPERYRAAAKQAYTGGREKAEEERRNWTAENRPEMLGRLPGAPATVTQDSASTSPERPSRDARRVGAAAHRRWRLTTRPVFVLASV